MIRQRKYTFRTVCVKMLKTCSSGFKKVLLFVHGTFSHCDTLHRQMASAGGPSDPYGEKFLADVRRRYDHVLAFNHPTLAVSPTVNAFDLAAQLRDPRGSAKSIDVIIHIAVSSNRYPFAINASHASMLTYKSSFSHVYTLFAVTAVLQRSNNASFVNKG